MRKVWYDGCGSRPKLTLLFKWHTRFEDALIYVEEHMGSSRSSTTEKILPEFEPSRNQCEWKQAPEIMTISYFDIDAVNGWKEKDIEELGWLVEIQPHDSSVVKHFRSPEWVPLLLITGILS